MISISREKCVGAVFTRPCVDEKSVEIVCPNSLAEVAFAPPKLVRESAPSHLQHLVSWRYREYRGLATSLQNISLRTQRSKNPDFSTKC